MLTGKRFWTLATVLGLCVLATAGCRRKKSNDSTFFGDSIFTTDTFPGDTVQNGNVADDGKGMSPSLGGANTGSVRVTFNGDRCTAMVTYFLGGSGFFGSGNSGLYAHYYDGTTWTPPVLLQTIDSNQGNGLDVGSVVHVALNTDQHTSSFAQDRNGDWMIFFKINDVDTDAGGPDDINTTLQYVYFNVEHSTSASRHYGFSEFSTRIDVQDETGENVNTFGIVSDGLCGQAAWVNGARNYTWGDQVTSVEVVFNQAENNDGVAGTEDFAVYSVRFDPAEATLGTQPITPTGTVRLSIAALGASDSGTSSEETLVYGEFMTYNNNLFIHVAAENDTIGDDPANLNGYGFSGEAGLDIIMENIAYNLSTGTIGAATELQSGAPAATDTVENFAEWIQPDGGFLNFNQTQGRVIYGSDEGLAVLVFYHCQVAGDLDGEVDFGDLTNDGRIILTELVESTGGFNGQIFLDLEQPLITDTVGVIVIDTRMSRNGDYIWCAWGEVLDSGITDEVAVFASQYTTTRINDDGTFPVALAFGDSVSAPIQVSADVDGEGVTWLAFQDCLGYVCGAQSDPNSMNLVFEQSSGTFDEIDRCELIADIIPPGCVPGFVTTIFEVSNAGEDGDYVDSSLNTAGNRFKATDGGHNGDIYAVYREDIDSTATDDFRCVAERDGTVFPGAGFIDTFVTFRQIPAQAFTFICLPAGQSIGRFDVVSLTDDQSRFHPNTFVHTLFFEDSISEFDVLNDALRTRQFNAADTGETFTEAFVPEAGAVYFDPFEITLPNVGDPTYITPPYIMAIGRDGDVAGVMFFSQLHVYYQECATNQSSIGWALAEGDSGDLAADVITPAGNPFLVDDSELESYVNNNAGNPVAFTKSCTCSNLGCMMAFWVDNPADSQTLRLHVRVRFNQGN
ncbi:MAG: hypothetical protein AAB074_22065 [Planctomycetota bacterium]